MRADARRNLELLVESAVEVFLESGPDASLDSIAVRAGVGIGTLYRRFADRESLVNAIAMHALGQSIEAAGRALDEATDGWNALRLYMHAAVDSGIGVLNLVSPMVTDPGWVRLRRESASALYEILEMGGQDGSIRPDVRMPDVGFGIIRFSRPVVTGIDPELDRAIAHRHLEIYIDGLHAGESPGGRLSGGELLEAFEADSSQDADWPTRR